MAASAAALSGLLFGCGVAMNVTVNPPLAGVAVGETLPLEVELNEQDRDAMGCDVSNPVHEVHPGSEFSAWVVQPADGATVRNGVFKARKPGTYEVAPVRPEGERELIHPAKIVVTSAQMPTLPPEPVTNPLAGTYKGTFRMASPDARLGADADVPLEFTVDVDGRVKGGFQYHGWPGAQVDSTFNGTVADDGRVTAHGTMTVSNKAGSNRGATALDGKISGDRFTGVLKSGSWKQSVTAKRQ